jgi:tetratricopeptide (TPR) repeat protein
LAVSDSLDASFRREVELMRHSPLVLLALAACATTPASTSGPDTATVAEMKAGPTSDASALTRRLETDRKIAAMLRSISARVRKGQGAELRDELQEQLRIHPGDSLLKIYCAWTSAPSEDAWEQINNVSKKHPGEPWSWVAQGNIYLHWRGFLEQADDQYQRALKAVPGFVPAEVGRADVLRLKGKLSEARAAYEAVLLRAPDWQEALLGLGMVQAALNDPAARASLERALQIDPEDFQAITAMAKLASDTKDSDTAIRLYRKVLEYDPSDRPTHLVLARLLHAKGDVASATLEYEAAMALASDAELASVLAKAYRDQNRPEDELRALEKLAELDATHPDPLLRMAELRKEQNDLEASESALRQASERKPDDPEILLALARLLRDRENALGAIEAYRAAKEKGSPAAGQELKALETAVSLPEKPISGEPNRIYQEVFRRLNKQFEVRQRDNKLLGGALRLKVSIDEEGKVTAVELIEDTVHDDVLTALIYFSLKDAIYPKGKRSPTFEFVLNSRK